MLDSNKSTNFNPKKINNFKPTYLCMMQYTSMYCTSQEYLQYVIFCTQYDTKDHNYSAKNKIKNLQPQ